MKKSDFVKLFKESAPVEMTNKEAKAVVDTFLDVLAESISKEEEVALTPFGKFTVTERAARKGRNPQTGEELDIPAKSVVKFKPSKKLKESV